MCNEHILQVENATFTLLVFATNGGMAHECKTFYKRLAQMIPEKRSIDCSTATNFVRTKISFSLLRSTLMCIRGSRSFKRDFDFTEIEQFNITANIRQGEWLYKGTAMGTRAAPNYANVYMGNFENKYIYQSPAMTSIAFYKRFIDDIFFIWIGGEHCLKKLLDHLNKVHDSIKFTSEYSTKAINFLDTTVIINDDGSLKTDLYYKDVDTHSFLDKTSCHPKHTKNSIPYSQFTRIKRICSDKETFERRAKEHKTFFKASGYTEKHLEKAIKRVNEASTDTRRKEDQNITPLITDFNPRTIDFKSVINKHWNITQTTEKGRKYLKAQPSVVYRRPRNLKDDLVRSKFKKVEGLTAKECNPCKRKRCENCNIVKNTQTFHSNTTGKSFKIFHDVNCQSDWVIYLMDCKNCQKQYVSKSKTPCQKEKTIMKHHDQIN